MKITILTAVLATLLMVSCKKDENKESTVDTATETTSPSPTEQEITPSKEGQTSTGAVQGTFDINLVKWQKTLKEAFHTLNCRKDIYLQTPTRITARA